MPEKQPFLPFLASRGDGRQQRWQMVLQPLPVVIALGYLDVLCNLWWHYLHTDNRLLQLQATASFLTPEYFAKLSMWCISMAGVTTPLDRHTSHSGFCYSLDTLSFFHSVLWQIFYRDSLLIFLTYCFWGLFKYGIFQTVYYAYIIIYLRWDIIWNG